MMMTGGPAAAAAVPLAALQAAGYRQRVGLQQAAVAASYFNTAAAGLRHAAPLTAIAAAPPTM